jgi:hypothetical protein
MSTSLSFIRRLIGPKLAVPSVSAGGAVDEPAACTWMLTFGYSFLNASVHNVIRFASVSDPTLDRLPETPLTR